jgi:membrane protease YdiL (CAAX protease family)
MELGGAGPKPVAWTLAAIAGLAAVLFTALFHARHLGPLDFWWWMAANILVLTGLSFAADKGYARRLGDDIASAPAKKVGLGVLSAVVLYAVFAAGKAAACKLLPFAPAGIAAVYRLRQGTGFLRAALLLGLLIGPGEEIFWRGFLQEKTGSLLGPDKALWLTALLYTLIHVASGNIILISAAGVCGVFWGVMYRAFRSPLLNVVSHTLWDLAVVLVFPL